MFKLNRETAYWICQCVGWFSIFLAAIPFSLANEKVTARHLMVGFSLHALGLLISHLYRNYIKKKSWIDLPLGKLILRCLAFSIVVSAFLTVMTFWFGIIFSTLSKEAEGYELSFIIFFNWAFMYVAWSVCYFGVHFFWNYRQSEVERWKLMADVKDAELKALKFQINPHFMFNMLNSIRALIVEDPERAQLVVTKMARLLRTALQSDKQATIPLEQELAMVRNYLELESIRLEERLQYEIDVPPEGMTAPVPAMIVHTLVENGVKHGVANLPKGGKIRVETQLDTVSLKIRVHNPGQLAIGPSQTGIGLANARERLKLHYGHRAGIQLSNSSKETVMAEINIPLELTA